jgi:hypothetical protein
LKITGELLPDKFAGGGWGDVDDDGREITSIRD